MPVAHEHEKFRRKPTEAPTAEQRMAQRQRDREAASMSMDRAMRLTGGLVGLNSQKPRSAAPNRPAPGTGGKRPGKTRRK